MNKKIYQRPALRAVTINVEGKLLVDSLKVYQNRTVSNGGWVKSDVSSSEPSYNVWDDDWSEE